jgi:hypothetical protein
MCVCAGSGLSDVFGTSPYGAAYGGMQQELEEQPGG